ncbi:hypothetical protein MKX03_023947 [Papaver bracteatum]|nr:hypothetical protein MKX03_023947 [Papaver bracteatum]
MGDSSSNYSVPLLTEENENSQTSLCHRFWEECKMTWYLAGPCILTSIFQFSLAFATQTWVGHVGTLELAVFGLQNLVISGLSYGIMIAELAGTFSLWMIPQLYMYALNFPMQRFLQAQSKVIPLAWISFVVPLSWFCVMRWGLAGAAASLNFSWVLVVILQFSYIVSGRCKESWSGFSWLAFAELLDFLWLSLASAVMLCLEYWAYNALIVFAGALKNAEVEVDAAAICMNVEGWIFMLPLGYIASISVRVSNELGAGNGAAAKFAVLVTVSISMATQTAFAALVFITRYDFPKLITDDKIVMKEVTNLAAYLCVTIILCGIQPVLTGMAIGVGWQASIAYVNITTYYLIGLPMGFLFGFKLDWGLRGLWIGTQIGVGLQTIVLLIMCWRADWDKEVQISKDRVSDDVGSREEQKLIH